MQCFDLPPAAPARRRVSRGRHRVGLAAGIALGAAVALAAPADAQQPGPATRAHTGNLVVEANAPYDVEEVREMVERYKGLGNEALLQPGNWVLPPNQPEGWRYSPLNQITTQNVSQLREVWSYNTNVQAGHEGNPVAVDGMMYAVTPFPNRLIAFDLNKSTPGNPHVAWIFEPQADVTAVGKACCDIVNRGIAYADGKIIYNVLDNTTTAVDAKTGQLVWKTNLGDLSEGETMTMAPMVIKDIVLVGNSGGELGVRGWVKALNLANGELLWTAYSTGPDEEVLIGPEFDPYYSWMEGEDLGVKTWPPDQWKLGGGTVWGWITYDPERDTFYYGAANPGVWNPELRPGLNLWSTAIFARDLRTGSAKWAYQKTPHDNWDYDGVNENIIATLNMNGQQRRVIVNFDRNGFAYTIDANTGQVLVAEQYVPTVNWARGVDLSTGLPQVVEEKLIRTGRMTTEICPSAIGSRDQQPASYNPRTQLFYTPTVRLCMDYGGTDAKYIAGTPYLGAAVEMYHSPLGQDARGSLLAWDATRGEPVWEIVERFPVWSGTVTTAGDLVFYGTLDGLFKAVNARTGEVLWQHKLPSGTVGHPITFLGPNGKQYVAIYAGPGGWYGAIVPHPLSIDDPYAALGAVGAAEGLKEATEPGGSVHVFALP